MYIKLYIAKVVPIGSGSGENFPDPSKKGRIRNRASRSQNKTKSTFKFKLNVLSTYKYQKENLRKEVVNLILKNFKLRRIRIRVRMNTNPDPGQNALDPQHCLAPYRMIPYRIATPYLPTVCRVPYLLSRFGWVLVPVQFT